MAFNDTETSIWNAEPIELYKFTGTFNTYYLTTYQQSVTSNLDTYTPLYGLGRKALKVGTQEDEQLALDIEMPYDHPLIAEYAYNTAPPTLELELRRAHLTDPDDTILMWKGKVLSFSVAGRVAKLRVPTLFAYALNGITPTPRYQAPCNHILYDARCGVNPATNQTVATVLSISGNVVEVDAHPYSAGELAGGTLIWASGGEERMITSHVGTSFTVTYAYAGLTVGESVTIRRGCDHSFATCKSKFSNGDRFGGCPLVPAKNPFSASRL